MIEITARLFKGHAYLAGETIECAITFSHPEDPSHKKYHGYNDVMETLAWASAQIHCQCTTSNKVVLSDTQSISHETLTSSTDSPRKSKGSPSKDDIEDIDTSFAPCKGDGGHVVIHTKPKILFCDLRLAMGESKTYVYRELLPCEAPPSYRGQAVKYSYKITIGTQRVNSPIKLLRVPFRVLVLSGIPDSSACGDSEDLTPSNPFLETQQKETPLDVALQMLQNVTARRSPNFYNITNGRGKVVRFCLFKQAFKLGEDIVGTFDFSDATVNCVQVADETIINEIEKMIEEIMPNILIFNYSVTLQSEEQVADKYKANAKQGPTVVSYNKHHETCLSWNQTHLILPIPLHITPAFSTDLVSLQWRLHFEFVTTVTPVTVPPMDTTGREEKTWQAPATLDIETMVWNLPLKILTTTGHHVSQGSHAQNKHTLVL